MSIDDYYKVCYYKRNKMIKRLFTTILISSLFSFSMFFISCKNAAETKIVDIESNTVKNQVKNREQSITWTIEIEPERLTTPVPKGSYKIDTGVQFTKDILKINPDFQFKTFPQFSDFGSLDTTKLPPAVKLKLQEFCEHLSKKSPEAVLLFNSKYVFSYVFFKNDLPEDLKISRWLFGEPFFTEEIILVPVRFYCNSGFFDVTIYVKDDGANEFYQITLDRWEKNDGR